MATSSGPFTLTINTNAGFGETGQGHIERQVLVRMLQQIAQEIGSGCVSSHIIDDNGNDIGSYTYGTGMINAGA